MRRLALGLTIPIAALLGAGAAQAQAPASGAAASPGQPGVTVRAPERMVCRAVTRTATRMRASRQCRPVSQLTGAAQQSDDERLSAAADTLDALGADDISTGCEGGLPPPPGPRPRG